MTAARKANEELLAQRAALYLRVSTGRQAESDLSIPDQRAQTSAWVVARGWMVAAEYIEPGASATDDRRPEFQRMVERACDGEGAFDVIVVHSFSRFFRDAFGLEFYIRKLAKHGVRLVSMTQELGDDPAQVMMRQVIALFDEYQSKENAKHVLRSMKENARQGFWNGAAPPFGYAVIAAEQRGAKTKKRLAIDPVEAEIVRLIFRLIRDGDGTNGPMGIKATACWLNERGYRTRRGARWGIGPLHKLVTNVVYKGEAVFNRMDSKTREAKPTSELITVEVEPIIAPAVFDAVQAQLKQRNPRVMPPRVVTGPTLLTGIATCASCGGGMTLRTGKSGRYRYYVCAAAAQTACAGRSVPMERLDRIVTDRLGDQLLTVERVSELLGGLMDRQSRREADYAGRLTALRGKLAEVEGRLGRLYQAIESGDDPNDPTLKERVAAVKTERDIAQATFDRAVGEMSPQARITEEKVAGFVALMRQNALSGETAFRRAWLRAVIDRVEVGDTEIRIHGRKTVLERLVMAGDAAPAGVPSFVRKWRTRVDRVRTNYWPLSKSWRAH